MAEPTTNNPEWSEKNNESLLAEILKSQGKQAETTGSNNPPPESSSATTNTETEENKPSGPKKPQEPISIETFIKLAASIFFVAVVFLGSIGAYVVLNPEDAVFLIKNLNINPNDVAIRLKQLINWTFGSIMFILSIVWIISLFRAFWTPKDLKRKRMLAWLTAWVLAVLFFSTLTFWIYIFGKIKTIDFINLSGNILIYDNDLYLHEEDKKNAQLTDGTNIIGPITLLFDIRANAKAASKEYLVDIQSYSIDSDGGVCNDGSSVVTGNNPLEEKSIICTFDKVKTYNIKGIYNAVSQVGERQKQTISMKIDPIEIRGVVSIKKAKNIQWDKIITLDAGSLKKLGTPRWIYTQSDKIVESSSITETLSDIPQSICLRLLSNGCDRTFILIDNDSKKVQWSITSIQDEIDPLLFHLSLSGTSIDQNQITNVQWLLMNDLWGKTVICSKWSGYDCEYRASGYGSQNIQVVIETADGQQYTLDSLIQIQEPLKLMSNMKVIDKNGILLNTKDTYQSTLKAYVIENALTPPVELTLDGRNIAIANPWYILESVNWKIQNQKEVEEKQGEIINITLDKPLRYTIEWTYNFRKTSTNTIESTKEMVIIDIEKKSLMPRIDIKTSSDYVPSIVTVDASQSESTNGEIKKFIFDFWEGKAPTEWDAIQQYEYVTPGDKEITATIISENGERAVAKKVVVLKDEAKTIDFTPSMTPGIQKTPIDFEATGTNGQVQDYIWNFWDNTQTTRGYSVNHIFAQAGIYNVSLTVVYTDGTRKTETRKYEVTIE